MNVFSVPFPIPESILLLLEDDFINETKLYSTVLLKSNYEKFGIENLMLDFAIFVMVQAWWGFEIFRKRKKIAEKRSRT